MKLHYFVWAALFLFCSCHSALDRTYIADRYELDLKQLGIEELVSAQEMFLINHVVLRERDYLDYELAGMPYSDILALGKDLQANGMSVSSTFPEVKMPKNLKVDIKNEGAGYYDNKQKLKFSATFTNTGSKDLALLDATFLVYGPFKDHIATTAYQINTKVKAGDKQKLFFLVDATTMRKNLLFGRNFSMGRLFMDDIIIQASIDLGGATVSTKNVNQFNTLDVKEQYVEPDYEFNYPKELKGTDWYTKDANGKATELHPGLRYYPQ